MKNKKVILTGGSGFIGSHIAEYFCEKRVHLSCGIRNSSNTSFLESLPVQLFDMDINDADSMRTAFKDGTFVIHTAGQVDDWSSYEACYQSNVEGTLNVLRACKYHNIRNVVITGSIASYGEESSKTVINEDSPYKPRYRYFLEHIIPSRMNNYRITKALATQKAIKYAEENEINLTILEPVWVYGEREYTTGFYIYMQAAKSRIPFMPGKSKNKFHVIYAKDLAKAYYQAYMKKLPGVNRFIIGNEHAENMNKVYKMFCKELGVKKPSNLPSFVAYPVGLVLELIGELMRSKNSPLLTRARVRLLYDSVEYSTRKASEKLEYQNKYSLEESIAKTVDWYKSNKLL